MPLQPPLHTMARALVVTVALLLLGAVTGALAQGVRSGPGRRRHNRRRLYLRYTAHTPPPPPPHTPRQISVSGAGCASSLEPGAPQELKAQPGDGKVTLTWKAPANGACVDTCGWEGGGREGKEAEGRASRGGHRCAGRRSAHPAAPAHPPALGRYKVTVTPLAGARALGAGAPQETTQFGVEVRPAGAPAGSGAGGGVHACRGASWRSPDAAVKRQLPRGRDLLCPPAWGSRPPAPTRDAPPLAQPSLHRRSDRQPGERPALQVRRPGLRQALQRRRAGQRGRHARRARAPRQALHARHPALRSHRPQGVQRAGHVSAAVLGPARQQRLRGRGGCRSGRGGAGGRGTAGGKRLRRGTGGEGAAAPGSSRLARPVLLPVPPHPAVPHEHRAATACPCSPPLPGSTARSTA